MPELPAALSGDRHEIEHASGRLSYYVAGDGPPLLLLHSINAAASAYEVRPIFEHWRAMRRVYAPDLPGYGHSDRSRRDYSVPLFVSAIADMLKVIERDCGNVPVDALAVSLSCEFLALATVQQPERFRTLSFVTPTAFNARAGARAKRTQPTMEIGWFYQLLSLPAVGRSLFRLLTIRKSIAYFLARTAGSQDVDEGMLNYACLTARQPGAYRAPIAFLSGRLFSTGIVSVYPKLTHPVWVAYGTKGDFRDFSARGWAEQRDNWAFNPYPTGALVHFEAYDEFSRELGAFMDGATPAVE